MRSSWRRQSRPARPLPKADLVNPDDGRLAPHCRMNGSLGALRPPRRNGRPPRGGGLQMLVEPPDKTFPVVRLIQQRPSAPPVALALVTGVHDLLAESL